MHTAVALDRRGRLAVLFGLGHAAAHHDAVSNGHITVHEDAAALFHQRLCGISRIGHGLVAADDILGLVLAIFSRGKRSASDVHRGVFHAGAAVTAHIVAADDLALSGTAGNHNTSITGDDEVAVGLLAGKGSRVLYHAAAH